MTTPRPSQRLVARLRAMGVPLPDEVELVRTRAGRAQRAAGAWSWAAYVPGGRELRLGSQAPITELLRAHRLTVSQYSPSDDMEVDVWVPMPTGTRWHLWLDEPETGTPVGLALSHVVCHT
jgi:hypothetical protein